MADASSVFEACERQLASDPRSSDAAACFGKVAQGDGLEREAARRLAALLSRYPRNHWLKVALGHLEWDAGPEHARELYAEAARGFARENDPVGEVRALYNLRNILYWRGKVEEARRVVEQTLGVARRSGQPLLIGQALLLEATHLRQTGEDVERAYRALRQAEPMLIPDAPYPFRLHVLRELASSCFNLGRFDEARTYYRRYEALAREAGDVTATAVATLNIAMTLLTELEELPRAEGRDDVIVLARKALELAIASGHPSSRVTAHQLLGDVLRKTDAAGARWHLNRCLTEARASQDSERLADCLWSMGAFLADTDGKAAHRCVDQAVALAVESGNKLSLAYASRQRMRVTWKTGPRDQAIERSLEALDTIEALRDLQRDASGSTWLFSAWTKDYYLALGRLLDRPFPPERRDLALAFSIAERLRARVLLERLMSGSSAPALPADHPSQKRRREILEGIVDAHRRLLHPGLGGDQRKAALAELERLELEESALRADAARATAVPKLPTTTFVSLDEVEEALAPDEALLSFQVALWEDVYGDFGGGSFLIVATRKGSRVVRLPDRTRLDPTIPVFLGLFERRDGSEAEPAVALYRDLLKEGLESLPSEVRRLIMVPDGSLHRLPFGALRPGAQSEPLAVRYQLGVVPSATLWLHWRRGQAPAADLAALVMADPEPLKADTTAAPTDASAEPAEERAWLLAEGVRLGRLPHARAEGRAVVRHLGGASRLLVGAEASELYLKNADLAGTGVLHFAAHAVVDEEHPERAAVLLAPGAASEDGFLQVREIGDLRLSGQLVVLSACQSASGSVLRGEGVLGLARAFFQSGARTVVGSLWPLRDDEAAVLFDLFYRYLASGSSVAEALRRAQEDAVRAGLPAAAWAGLVVLGDANLGFPARRPASPAWRWSAALAAVLAGGAVLGFRWHRRRARRDRP